MAFAIAIGKLRRQDRSIRAFANERLLAGADFHQAEQMVLSENIDFSISPLALTGPTTGDQQPAYFEALFITGRVEPFAGDSGPTGILTEMSADACKAKK